MPDDPQSYVLSEAADVQGSIRGLADILARREVTSVAYLHTDHFEPWKGRIGPSGLAHVEAYLEQTQRLFFGSRNSLFYKPFLAPPRLRDEAWDDAAERGYIAGPDDALVFDDIPRARRHMAGRALRGVDRDSAHEIHLHLHHEHWTRNDRPDESPVGAWLRTVGTDQADRARFDFVLRLALARIAEELGRPLVEWGFVHGCWALAASDPRICRINDELARLQRAGCIGDFTFPAGRHHCNPAIAAPLTCLPIDAERTYDDPAADPRPVDLDRPTVDPGRFLIWHSPLGHLESSLDSYGRDLPLAYADPVACVTAWFERSPVIEGCLIVKTHGHAMSVATSGSAAGFVAPHATPEVRRTFGVLSDAVEKADVPVSLVTVREVARRLGRPLPNCPAPPDEGLARRLSVVVCERLRGWLADGSIDGSVLGDYYLQRLAADRFVADYDIATAAWLSSRFCDDTPVLEVGCGLGSLSLLASAWGCRIDGLDASTGRIAVARRLAGAVQRHLGLPVPDFRRAVLPAALDGTKDDSKLAPVLVATNLIGRRIDADSDTILDGLARAGHVILDLACFGHRRGPVARARLKAEIARRGLEPDALIHAGDRTEIWHFINRRSATAAPV